jgi:predicted N-acetyltransferase YhbS
MPRTSEPSWEDGMRSLHEGELEGIVELTSAVFRPTLVADYPHFFNRENASNLRVVVEDGKVVSHIGTLRRDASILGCTVRMAALGGVATYEEHRGKGHATALFQDTMRVCKEDGVDFMLVSGYRKMYHRFGCRIIGKDWRARIDADQAGAFDDGKVEISEATEKDLPDLMALYRREPVRWIRPPSDCMHALAGIVMNQPSVIHVLREKGIVRGYVIVQNPKGQGQVEGKVFEVAGEREVLAGALGELLKMYNMSALSLHVMGFDGLLLDVLKGRGATCSPEESSGTVTLINFTQFMEKMRPYFTEVVGERVAKGLVFEEPGDQMIFRYGGDAVVADNQGQAAELIFGTHEGVENRLLEKGGKAGEVLADIFPIPALWYGLNFV